MHGNPHPVAELLVRPLIVFLDTGNVAETLSQLSDALSQLQ